MQEDIFNTAQKFNQGHLKEHYESLTDPKLKEQFLKQIKELDFEQTDQLYKDVYLHHKNNPTDHKKVKF